jgi:hypothetical protein
MLTQIVILRHYPRNEALVNTRLRDYYLGDDMILVAGGVSSPTMATSLHSRWRLAGVASVAGIHLDYYRTTAELWRTISCWALILLGRYCLRRHRREPPRAS